MAPTPLATHVFLVVVPAVIALAAVAYYLRGLRHER